MVDGTVSILLPMRKTVLFLFFLNIIVRETNERTDGPRSDEYE